MAGRARDQRDHGRRGPAAARVPRPARRRRGRGGGPLDPVPAAGRRHLGQLLRRARRPVHHGGGLPGPAAGRRRAGRAAHEAGPGLDHRAGRRRGDPRVHPDLAGPVRPVVVGRPAGHPARADLPAVLVPAQHLRLGLLGAADDRGAGRGPVVPPRAAHRDLHRRAQDRRPARPGSPPAPRPRRAAHRRHDQPHGPLGPLLQRPRHGPARCRPVLPPPPPFPLPTGKVG